MKANKENRRILLMLYYAGHGEMYNGSTTTQIVFNGDTEGDGLIRYPLEFNLYALSSCKNTYIIAILDSCRSKTQLDTQY